MESIPAGLTRKSRAQLTRQKILDVALVTFADQSYDAVGTTQLARTAGVAHGLLFHHFENKRGLYLEAMREAARRLDRIHTEVTDRTDLDPGDQIRRTLRVHLDYMTRHRDLTLELLRGRIAADRQAWEIFEAERTKVLTWLLDRIQLDSTNRALRLTARASIAALDEATIQWIESDQPFAIEEMIEVQMRFMIAALRAAVDLDPELDVTRAVGLLR
jgi:AcrR family transcriptional regulator